VRRAAAGGDRPHAAPRELGQHLPT